MKLKNKQVLVYGLGASGRAVIKILQKEKAYVSFYDDNVEYFDYVGFERNPQDKKYDLVVVSPGIKVLNNKLLKHFREKNIPILSELDFAYLRAKGKIIAITGTNGKTTTCMLTNKILRQAGLKTFLCGNIGLPFSAVCDKTTNDSVVVCEVSNFQLEASKFFRADIACILNIKPDHLDRHGSFEEYKKSKFKLIENSKKKDMLILNFDDVETKKSAFLHKKTSFFSKNRLKKGVFCHRNQIYINKKPILSLNNISLKGEKNLENVLASVAICSKFKVGEFAYEMALDGFVPASHRMQEVGVLNNVTYIDDSKATNVASTVACVEAFEKNDIILLLGGQGKDIEYDEIFAFKIKCVVCFGQDRQNIFECAKKHNQKVEIFEKFDDAVLFCKEFATEGDFVLLSPACSSFDEFSSYAERGERFKTLILGCKDEK